MIAARLRCLLWWRRGKRWDNLSQRRYPRRRIRNGSHSTGEGPPPELLCRLSSSFFLAPDLLCEGKPHLTGHSPFSHRTLPVRPPLWQSMQRALAVQLRCSKRRCSPSSSRKTPSLTPSSTAQSSQSAGPSSALEPMLCTGLLQPRHFTVPAEQRQLSRRIPGCSQLHLFTCATCSNSMFHGNFNEAFNLIKMTGLPSKPGLWRSHLCRSWPGPSAGRPWTSSRLVILAQPPLCPPARAYGAHLGLPEGGILHILQLPQ